MPVQGHLVLPAREYFLYIILFSSTLILAGRSRHYVFLGMLPQIFNNRRASPPFRLVGAAIVSRNTFSFCRWITRYLFMLLGKDGELSSNEK